MMDGLKGPALTQARQQRQDASELRLQESDASAVVDRPPRPDSGMVYYCGGDGADGRSSAEAMNWSPARERDLKSADSPQTPASSLVWTVVLVLM